MGVTLERVQFKFASIIGELCSEPDILSQFAVWVDLRLAEYKLKGSISLDCSGDTPDPIWLKGILSALLEKRLTAQKVADQHTGRGAVGSPMFHSTPIAQRVGSASFKQEATDEGGDVFPVGFHAVRNTDSAPLSYNTHDFRKRRACETVTRPDSNSALPTKMRRIENTKDNPIVISHESLMSVINPRESEEGTTVLSNADPLRNEHVTELSLSSDIDTTLQQREAFENDGTFRKPVVDLNAMPAPSDIELPTLSPVCLALLRRSDARSMIHLVREAAAYYHHYYPQMKDRAYYAAVGRKLVEKYPCLSFPGNNPWSVLIGKLSQKMRLLRLREKAEREKEDFGTSTQSQMGSAPGADKSNMTESQEAEKKSLERHVESLERLRELWNQSDPDRAIVKKIMTTTWHYRRSWLTRNKALTIKTIQTMYPCFEDVEFILDDFYYSMGPRAEAETHMIKKLTNVFSQAAKLISRRLIHEDDLKEASNAVLALEKYIARTKGKGEKSESILQIVEIEDCTEDLDVWASGLAGDDTQPPSLIVFVMGGEYLQSFVVGGGVAIDARAATLLEALVVVLAVYTVFCVDFPRIYCQLLGLLQESLTGKGYTGIKTLGYLHVLKAVRSDS